MKTTTNHKKHILTFLVFFFVLSSVVRSEALPWKAGTAKTIITPEKQVWLAGYGYKRAPEEILHDLWVKVLALEDRNGQRCLVVTTDLMGIPKYMYENISQKLKERFFLERSQILLTFSHNHCAPRLHEDLVDYYPVDSAQIQLIREYSDKLEDKILETVARSLQDLSPARLTIGEGTADFAVNRRNNVEADVPGLLAAGTLLKGPVDHSVPVLAIYKGDNQLEAIVFGYACHPTTLSFDKWCGDYPGFAQIELEKNHPGTMALFYTGCGADQNPLPRRDVLLCEQYGKRLSAAVEKALAGRLKPVPSELRMAFEFVDLDYLAPLTREEMEDALHDQETDSSARVRIRASWAGRMLKQMDAGEPFASSYSYPIQVWRLGGMLNWISLGGEAVVDYSLRFKREFGPNTWVCGYANILVAYIPSLRVYNEGGYEGGAFLYEYGLPANRWAGDVEERVVKTVHRLVRQVQRPIDNRDSISERKNFFNQVMGVTLQEHQDELSTRLYDEYLPFWDNGGYDKEYGGFICNLTEEGIPVDDEKFIWYQGRALWVYSFLYNNFGHNPKFLEIAQKTRDFLVNEIYLGDGRWAEIVHRDGKVIKGVEVSSDIYGWLFAANGLAEYYRISGKKEDIRLVKKSIRAAVKAYDSPQYQKGTDFEGLRIQGHSMILIRLLTQLLEYHKDNELEKLLDFHSEKIMTNFYDPRYRISNERLNHDYSRIEGEEGLMFLGHSLETQWMVMQLALQKKDQVLFDEAKTNFKRYLELGWDPVFDGWASEDFHIFDGEDFAAGTDYSTKTMWAHVEILVGCMLVFENSGEQWALEWYNRTWEYVKKTFCLGVGAWEQAANRQGVPISREKWGINPKRRGNFHQPRFLMLNLLSIERLIKEGESLY